MNINVDCLSCTVNKMQSLFDQFTNVPDQKMLFMKRVYLMAASADEAESAPGLSGKMLRLLKEYIPSSDPYAELKTKYNHRLLTMETDLMTRISDEQAPLLLAIKYAMIGNFIDFGAMDEVDDDILHQLIDQASQKNIETKTYHEFTRQLEKANKLVYLGDNAGEIVLDKLLVRTLKERYPKLDMTFVVRGAPVFNDITKKDALEVGMDKLVQVIDNGSDIPGTDLNQISLEAREIIEAADIVLAKGQGNFESLAGCGLNIFYLFLCKCDLFTQRFGMKPFQGVFAEERKL